MPARAPDTLTEGQRISPGAPYARAMATYYKALADLRRRATSQHDIVRGPVTLDDVQRLRAAVQTQFGMTIPKAYEDFLRTCNGFRVDGGRILGVDAEFMTTPPADAPTHRLDACLAFNLERRTAVRSSGREEPIIYLAWYDRAAWGMRQDGTYWEIDPVTLENIEEWSDCGQMLTSVTNRIGGKY